MSATDARPALRASIVILTYNGADLIRRCLDAVLGQNMPAGSFEVIVADNASTDGGVALVRRDYPQVTLLALDRNYGFAEGNNIGARQARGEWVVFLNTDTEVEPDWLPQLLAVAEAHPQAVLLHAAQMYPWAEGRLMFSDLCRWGFVRYYPVQRDAAPIPTLFVSGATAMARRSWLEEAGEPFDAGFFMYSEDRDLGMRANAQGHTVLLAPAAAMWHYQNNTLDDTRKAWRVARLSARNSWRAYLKNMYLTEFLLFAPAVCLGCLLKPWEFPGKTSRRLAAGLGLLALTLWYLPAALWYYARYPEARRASLARRRLPWGGLLRRLRR